jgi:hypothetical protein
MSQFPLTLKKQLVDDWEFVTQLGKVFNSLTTLSFLYLYLNCTPILFGFSNSYILCCSVGMELTCAKEKE